jgi:hypothetical protein
LYNIPAVVAALAPTVEPQRGIGYCGRSPAYAALLGKTGLRWLKVNGHASSSVAMPSSASAAMSVGGGVAGAEAQN